jgi:hypothetical protein
MSCVPRIVASFFSNKHIQLCVLVLLLGVNLSGSLAIAETASVTADSGSAVCLRKEQASKVADSSAINRGRDACRALGSGWRFSKKIASGQEDCTPCNSPNEYRCKVTQASFECINTSRNSNQSKAGLDTSTTRVGDPNLEIACAEAKLLASKDGTPSDCSCEFKGGRIHVCTVYSSGPSPEPTIIQTLRTKLRQELQAWCEANESECRDPKHPNYIRLRSVATGVRG